MYLKEITVALVHFLIYVQSPAHDTNVLVSTYRNGGMMGRRRASESLKSVLPKYVTGFAGPSIAVLPFSN